MNEKCEYQIDLDYVSDSLSELQDKISKMGTGLPETIYE